MKFQKNYQKCNFILKSRCIVVGNMCDDVFCGFKFIDKWKKQNPNDEVEQFQNVHCIQNKNVVNYLCQ